jgi:hypothetical protein
MLPFYPAGAWGGRKGDSVKDQVSTAVILSPAQPPSLGMPTTHAANAAQTPPQLESPAHTFGAGLDLG